MIDVFTSAHIFTPASTEIFQWLDAQGWYSRMESPAEWDYNNWCLHNHIVVSFEDPCKAMLFKLSCAYCT